jgi:hypothetical protein
MGLCFQCTILVASCVIPVLKAVFKDGSLLSQVNASGLRLFDLALILVASSAGVLAFNFACHYGLFCRSWTRFSSMLCVILT